MTNLLASLNTRGEKILLVGYSNVTNLRINSIIESNAYPILLIPEEFDLPSSVKQQASNGKLQVINDSDYASNIEYYLRNIGRNEVDNIIDRVFVTLPQHQRDLKEGIFRKCQRLRIPINITDSPEFCTFTLLSSYNQGDFQLGVTTNGKGCKLASRLKREIVHKLPGDIDAICDKVGELRRQIQLEDEVSFEIGDDDDDSVNTHKFNSLVHEFNQTQEEVKGRRNRWLSQIVEYYPLSKLATLSIEDLRFAYDKHKRNDNKQRIDVDLIPKSGKIALVGSGPGSVALLTLGALQTIHQADLILADKLVPQEVLDLIPKNHGPELFIARKFPGNAERAQEELLTMGLEALEKGKFVLRLKQGDPYIFGRGGEEYNYFAQHGYEPIVIPGISSALAAPVVAGIPMTHRDVADQVLICTGTGRKGAVPNLPSFDPSRTTIFLMALHRIVDLVPVLVKEKGWSPNLPVAIVERATCPDQRVIRTTLEKLGDVVELCGSRPPGLLVTGYACEVIHKNPTLKNWLVSEGFQYNFDNSKISVV